MVLFSGSAVATISPDYLIAVENGEVPGRSLIRALGERESMGTTASGEDIWRGNELTPAPTSDTSVPTPPAGGEQMTISCESSSDTAAGSGVQSVRIHYLDDSGNEQTEDKATNGGTVDTTATNIRFVNDFYAVAAGSNGVAEGHVKIHAKSDAGLVYNMIAAGGNKSMVPLRMVPAAKTGILIGWHAEEAQSKRCSVRIRSTDMFGALLPGTFCFKDPAYINGTATGFLPVYASVPALSIIKVSAWPDAVGAEASCGYLLMLIDD